MLTGVFQPALGHRHRLMTSARLNTARDGPGTTGLETCVLADRMAVSGGMGQLSSISPGGDGNQPWGPERAAVPRCVPGSFSRCPPCWPCRRPPPAGRGSVRRGHGGPSTPRRGSAAERRVVDTAVSSHREGGALVPSQTHTIAVCGDAAARRAGAAGSVGSNRQGRGYGIWPVPGRMAAVPSRCGQVTERGPSSADCCCDSGAAAPREGLVLVPTRRLRSSASPLSTGIGSDAGRTCWRRAHRTGL